MSEENTLVIVAGYQDLDSARHDFAALADHARGKSLLLQGAVLVGKDAEGNHHIYSFLGIETYRQVSIEPIPTGDVTVRMLFASEASVVGSGGRVTLCGRFPRAYPGGMSALCRGQYASMLAPTK